MTRAVRKAEAIEILAIMELLPKIYRDFFNCSTSELYLIRVDGMR